MKTDLQTLSETARELANTLFSTKSAECSQMTGGKPSCIQAEEDRALTRDEKRQGWSHRPFYAYDSSRMCSGCQAYYHAERAAQVLHEMRCWQVRAEAEEARKAVQAIA